MRYTTLEMGQSRAAAANVALSNYRYDNGNFIFYNRGNLQKSGNLLTNGDFEGTEYATSRFTLNVKLNTDFEGAELHFPRQKWSNKDIPKGWCFVWPSQVTHPHEADPLISGVKYTLASWTHPIKWSVDENFSSIYHDDIIIP